MNVPLLQYLSMIPVTRTISPPGYPNQCLVLTDEFKQLMRRLLKLMPDPQTNNRCLYGLNAGNVMVDQWGRPFLDAVFWTNYDSNLARMNYASVEEIFRVTIFNGKLASLPPDFQELLHVMRTEGDMVSYAIQHHCSLVWPDGKKELFSCMYDFSHGILRKWPYTWYEEVMSNLVFPVNWHRLIQGNPYLRMFYSGSTYPQETQPPKAGIEVLRFMRNTYSHCLDHAWNTATRQLLYGREQVGEMLETVFPLVLHSFQVELDKRGLLRPTKIESLFH